VLFDSTNPTAWDPAAHQRHLSVRELSLACGYCVRGAFKPPSPSEQLLAVVFGATKEASQADLSWMEPRCPTEDQRSWVRQWPGEHYRLLSGLVRALRPNLIVEVGTFTGSGSLALIDGTRANGNGAKVITYDIFPWGDIPGTLLQAGDFVSGELEQRIGDLAEDSYFADQQGTLLAAELIFVDGPKDSKFEPIFFSRLLDLLAGSRHVVVADDIHFLNMVQLWNGLKVDKLDITSFGHWSGTGIMLTA
jgi:predicted O-methyltransferase YrrM